MIVVKLISLLCLFVNCCCSGLNFTRKVSIVELPVIEAIASKQQEFGRIVETTIKPEPRHGKNIGNLNGTELELPKDEKNVTTKILGLPDPGDDPLGQLSLVCKASYPVQWGFRLYQVF